MTYANFKLYNTNRLIIHVLIIASIEDTRTYRPVIHRKYIYIEAVIGHYNSTGNIFGVITFLRAFK